MDSSSYSFKWSVLNNGRLESTFIFQKVSSPASSENEMSPNPSHHYQISFPGWSEYEISKCHSPVYRNTEYQVSFPGWSDDETSLNFLLKCHSPFCRMTKCQKCHPQCVWSRDVTDQNVCFYKPSIYKYVPNFPIQLST